MPILGVIASSTRQGQVTVDTGAMFPLQVITVGENVVSSVTFSNIPATYKHLQLRAFARTDRSTYNVDEMYVQFNGNTTASNYTTHNLYANNNNFPGTVVSTGGGSAFTPLYIGANNGAAPYGGWVIDILDYANTSVNKTLRGFGGADSNGNVSGFCSTVMYSSQLWKNTNAISSIRVVAQFGNFQQYSNFALYGIKSS